MVNVRVKVEIPGIEKVEELIKKHYKILEEMQENLNQIHYARMDLELKINQPPEKAPGAEAPDIKGITINLPD